MTNRLMSLLMIVASMAGLLATELDKFPATWHPYIVAGAAVLLALSQSVQQVAKGQE